MKRYELLEDSGTYEFEQGDYVLYDDVKKLIEEMLADKGLDLQGTEHNYRIRFEKIINPN